MTDLSGGDYMNETFAQPDVEQPAARPAPLGLELLRFGPLLAWVLLERTGARVTAAEQTAVPAPPRLSDLCRRCGLQHETSACAA